MQNTWSSTHPIYGKKCEVTSAHWHSLMRLHCLQCLLCFTWTNLIHKFITEPWLCGLTIRPVSHMLVWPLEVVTVLSSGIWMFEPVLIGLQWNLTVANIWNTEPCLHRHLAQVVIAKWRANMDSLMSSPLSLNNCEWVCKTSHLFSASIRYREWCVTW